MKKTISCIICPQSCLIEVNGDEINENMCDKGRDYAIQEITDPKRILTTTVMLSDGRVLPVRSKNAVKKSELIGLINKIRTVVFDLPTSVGQILYEIPESDVQLIATDLNAAK